MNVLSTTEAATRSPGHTHQQLSWAALSALSLRRADSFFFRRCYNSPGSFTCGQCPLGTFTGDGKSGCVDVDECTSGTSVCDPLTQCKVHALSICLVESTNRRTSVCEFRTSLVGTCVRPVRLDTKAAAEPAVWTSTSAAVKCFIVTAMLFALIRWAHTDVPASQV